ELAWAVESQLPSPAFVWALATAAFNADLVAARFAEYTRSALNAPAPPGEARSTPCVPALAVLMVRSFRSVLLPKVTVEPPPLTVMVGLVVAAVAAVAAVLPLGIPPDQLLAVPQLPLLSTFHGGAPALNVSTTGAPTAILALLKPSFEPVDTNHQAAD